jgi:GNAT superfamily N-acetyltransferase
MATFDIRRYHPNDADRVRRVHEAAFQAAPIEFIEDAPDEGDLRNLASIYLDGAGDFLVGELSEIVAAGGFKPVDEETVELKRIRVRPNHQRNGYGRALLETIETRAHKQGYTAAVLETHVALHAAIRFYEANGYDTGRQND